MRRTAANGKHYRHGKTGEQKIFCDFFQYSHPNFVLYQKMTMMLFTVWPALIVRKFLPINPYNDVPLHNQCMVKCTSNFLFEISHGRIKKFDGKACKKIFCGLSFLQNGFFTGELNEKK